MLRGEYIKSKVYASCLRVFRQLVACTFQFRGFKDKKTLHERIEASQTKNKL